MYLVDTNVISAAAPTKPMPDLARWMDCNSQRLCGPFASLPATG